MTLPKVVFAEAMQCAASRGLILNKLNDSLRDSKKFNLRKFMSEVKTETEVEKENDVLDRAEGRTKRLKHTLGVLVSKFPDIAVLVKVITNEFESIINQLLQFCKHRPAELLKTGISDIVRELNSFRVHNKSLTLELTAIRKTNSDLSHQMKTLREAKIELETRYDDVISLFEDTGSALFPSQGGGSMRRPSSARSLPPVPVRPSSSGMICKKGSLRKQSMVVVAPEATKSPNEVSHLVARMSREIEALRAGNMNLKAAFDKKFANNSRLAEEIAELREKLSVSRESLQESSARYKSLDKMMKGVQSQIAKSTQLAESNRILKSRLRCLTSDVSHLQTIIAQFQLSLEVNSGGITPQQVSGVLSSSWSARLESRKRRDRYSTIQEKPAMVPSFLKGRSIQTVRARQLHHQEVRAFIKDVFTQRLTIESLAGGSLLNDVYFEKYLHAKFNIREQMLEWSYSVCDYSVRTGLDDWDLIVFVRIFEKTLPTCWWDKMTSLSEDIRTELVNKERELAVKKGQLPIQEVLQSCSEMLPRDSDRVAVLTVILKGMAGEGDCVDKDVVVSEKSQFLQELKRQLVYENDDLFYWVKRRLIQETGIVSEEDSLQLQSDFLDSPLASLFTQPSLDNIVIHIQHLEHQGQRSKERKRSSGSWFLESSDSVITKSVSLNNLLSAIQYVGVWNYCSNFKIDWNVMINSWPQIEDKLVKHSTD